MAYGKISVSGGYPNQMIEMGKIIAELIAVRDKLLSVCQEIANDSKVDLVDSERRIRLYHAIDAAERQKG